MKWYFSKEERERRKREYETFMQQEHEKIQKMTLQQLDIYLGLLQANF